MRRANRQRVLLAIRALTSACTAVAAMAAGSNAARAHETQAAGDIRLTIGWLDEPALAGTANAVEVAVADAAGRPRTDIGGSLRVEILFGAERVVLALAPTGEPGTLAASLVPTRPGTYTFHVMGSVAGQVVDVISTCSDQTFDCVTDGARLQFPERDPASRELAARLEHESRATARAAGAASDARRLALAAATLGTFALLTTLTNWALTRRRRA